MKLKPSKTISVSGVPYLHRWHLIPRNRFFNIYLHKFVGNDDARALHDHPWWSFSIRLKGKLREHYRPMDNQIWWVQRSRMAPRLCFRSPTFAHRLELIDKKPAWTLFITGPVIRLWGFHCGNKWKPWFEMTTRDGKPIGGCDDQTL